MSVPVPRDLTDSELAELATRVRTLVASPEWQERLRDRLKESAAVEEGLRRAAAVDPKTLHEPFTL